MSIKVMTWVWEHSRSKGSSLLLALALADAAWDDGTNADPSIKTLANKTRLTERAVQMLLRQLEDAGEISQHGFTSAGVNIYRVCMEVGGGENFSPGEDGSLPLDSRPFSPLESPLFPPTLGTGLQLKPPPSSAISFKNSSLTDKPVGTPNRDRSKRVCRIPADFSLTPPMATYARRQGIQNPAKEFAEFRSFHEAKGQPWFDWVKVWQLWCRRAGERLRGQPAWRPPASVSHIPTLEELEEQQRDGARRAAMLRQQDAAKARKEAQ